MKKIVLASNNKHKVKEFKDILKDYEILTMSDIGFDSDIVEDGNSFLENSLIKAKTISEYLKSKNLDYIVIADDSGLCCDALNGEPGIHSARYASDHDIKKNRDVLINNLKGKDKKAYFNCTIVVYYPDGSYKHFEGKTYGTIIDKERGKNDFGYDCIFLSDDLNKTFGEASEEEKNSVSHRGRAIEEMLKEL
ncbi:MAG: RdgB/HAM1 family non-canonical purine NTP pyrophosphatase [Bacilli bacterium]|nr:RdgB/HAM1 family non-canonical purine NTP pyrophosphatase [Bacilli bacterium]